MERGDNVGADLNEVFKRLNKYFEKYRVVSEDEIAAAVADEVSRIHPATKKKLEEELRGDLDQVLVDSIVADPISVYSPNLTSKRNYLGETFYHYPTHDFLADELEEAFKRLTKLRAAGRLQSMAGTVQDLLQKSGYQVVKGVADDSRIEMLATKGDRKLSVFVIPSINFAPEYAEKMAGGQEYILVIPTEKTPAPFIQFCHDKAQDFGDKKVQIWVIDPEKGSVNPFLGYTHDDDIYRHFDNPKLAAFACRMYGVGRDLWVRSS